jgi:hypothetical protein
MYRFLRYVEKMAGGNALPRAPRHSSAILAGSGATRGIAAVALIFKNHRSDVIYPKYR